MYKLIIIRGISSIGKSSTLDVLFKRLLSAGATLIHPLSKNDYKYFAILNVGKHRVGIITVGDPGSWPEIEKCLQLCLANNCDRIFCASRTSGAVYNGLFAFATSNSFATIETSPLFARNWWITGINIDVLHEIFAEMLNQLI